MPGAVLMLPVGVVRWTRMLKLYREILVTRFSGNAVQCCVIVWPRSVLATDLKAMPTLSIDWVLTISSMDKALSLCEREGRKEVCFYAQSIWTVTCGRIVRTAMPKKIHRAVLLIECQWLTKYKRKVNRRMLWFLVDIFTHTQKKSILTKKIIIVG